MKVTAHDSRAASLLLDILFEDDAVGRCLVAPDGSVLRANREWLRSTGFGLDEVLGMNVVDLFPGTRDGAIALHARVRAGHRVEVPRHAQTVNGRETWWEGSIDPIPMESGTGLLITAREAHGEPRGPERGHVLDASSLARFPEENPDPVLRVSERGTVLYANRAALTRLSALGVVQGGVAPDPIMEAVERSSREDRRVQCEVECGGAVFSFSVMLVGAEANVYAQDITARKRAEESLRGREVDLARAQALAHLGNWRWDLVRDTVSWSTELYRIFGVDPGTFVPSNAAAVELIHPEDRARHASLVAKALSGATVEPFESRIVRPGGEERTVLASGFEIERDAGGKPSALFGAILDTTERKRAEDALRASEQRSRRYAGELQAMLDSVPAGVFIARDPGAQRIDANRSGLEMLRLAPGVNASKSAPAAETPDYRVFRDGHEVSAEDLPAQRAARGEEVRAWDCEVRFPDGESRHLLGYASPVRDPTGAPSGSVTTFVDITERKRAEEALKLSETRLRRLYDSGMMGVLHFDLDGPVTDANDKFLSMLGYTREDLEAGRIRWDLMTPPEYREADERGIAELKAGGVDTPYEKEYIRKDGFRVPILIGAATYDESRRRGIAFVLDVTERTRALEALREADRRKTEFLAVLSHELRNPIAPIRNSVYLLGRAPPDGEAFSRAQQIIERQVDHLARLVDDLLDVMRITRGKVELQRTRVDLRELVRQAIDDVRVNFARAGVELRAERASGHAWVDADATRIAQIVGNLLHNAQKFTPAGGAVTVALTSDAGKVRLSVKDTGEGMEPGHEHEMFEPFVQGDQGLARTKGGLGLGLSLVKAFVEMHGGTVSARSEGKGRGTEFVVILPLATNQAPQQNASGHRSAGTCRILVVEDNADAARTLADVFELDGHVVQIAKGGREGVDLAREQHPDVIFCDLGLPDVDGYEVARMVRSIPGLERVRLIALTGYAQPEDRERALQAGFDHHVAKPPDPEMLVGLLRVRS